VLIDATRKGSVSTKQTADLQSKVTELEAKLKGSEAKDRCKAEHSN
jgi:hypothetical protein